MSLFILLIKALGVYLFYKRFVKMCYLRWLYGRRGVGFMCTVPIPILGDIVGYVRRVIAVPDRSHITKFFEDSFPEKIPGCIGMFWPHGLQLIITDADYLQDLYQTYNDVFTKHGHAQRRFRPAFWHSILFAKSVEPSYKPRRKLISHAFYASKLRAMGDTIFEGIH